MRLAYGVDQNVRWLQIPVQNSPHVRMVNSLGRLGQESRCRPEIGLERRELLGEVAPIDQFHTEELLTVVLTHFVDGHNARVIEQGNGLSLVLESAQLGLVGQRPGLDHLHSHGTIQRHLPRLVDNAHAAATQLFLKLVIAEIADGGAWRQTRRGLVPVIRAGRPIGVGRPVVSGVTRTRVRARGGPAMYAAVASALVVVISGEWPEPLATGDVVASAAATGSGISPVFAWVNRQSGQRPSGAFAGCRTPQPGHRLASGDIGRLSWVRRRPRSIRHSAGARAKSTVASGVLSHKPPGTGYLPIPLHPWPGYVSNLAKAEAAGYNRFHVGIQARFGPVSALARDARKCLLSYSLPRRWRSPAECGDSS